MLNDKLGKVRLFLIEQGFFQEPTINAESGSFYKFIIPDSRNTFFIVDLKNHCAEAHYPDFKYNLSNPYSTKETIVNIDWNLDEEVDLIIQNLICFFNKILTIVQKG